MALSSQQKISAVSLVIYWPVIFLLTHIPIPQLVYEARISDKIPHFLCYLILIFLLWYATGHENKVNWRKASVWWVFLAVVGYAIVDEWLQDYVGRNADIQDIYANLSGMVAGVIVVSIFTFWPALLIIIATTIFLLTNLAKVNPAELIPVTNAAFHLFSYMVFTLVWIKSMYRFRSANIAEPRWLTGALALPIVFLLSVKLSSVILDRNFDTREMMLCLAAILATVAAIFLIALYRQRTDNKPSTAST